MGYDLIKNELFGVDFGFPTQNADFGSMKTGFMASFRSKL
jgi:hypothetical protein